MSFLSIQMDQTTAAHITHHPLHECEARMFPCWRKCKFASECWTVTIPNHLYVLDHTSHANLQENERWDKLSSWFWQNTQLLCWPGWMMPRFFRFSFVCILSSNTRQVKAKTFEGAAIFQRILNAELSASGTDPSWESYADFTVNMPSGEASQTQWSSAPKESWIEPRSRSRSSSKRDSQVNRVLLQLRVQIHLPSTQFPMSEIGHCCKREISKVSCISVSRSSLPSAISLPKTMYSYHPLFFYKLDFQTTPLSPTRNS